jgi:hypothetical protein
MPEERMIPMAEVKRIFTVNDKPFFPVGGQSMNQSGYNASEAGPALKAVKALHGNTILIPVYWEQVEPAEGCFDFTSVDELLASARQYDLKLILLWFAIWKNGNMDYSPAWVKTDSQRFKRVIDSDGKLLWVLSSHWQATIEAEKKAFAALCDHLKAKDSTENTVIGLQIENEPGIMGSDRDYGSEAQVTFESAVPEELVKRMKTAGKGRVFDMWQHAGGRDSGNWPELFGPAAGEMMTAWSIATHIDRLAKLGKGIHDIPMYINVWLQQDWEVPGESYPSGGAVTNALDIYKWFTPHVDVIAPDIYIGDSRGYEATCATYTRDDNPLYVPESSTRGSNAWLMFRAIADYNAIGYHCFGVQSILAEDDTVRPDAQPVVDSFRCLSAVIPLLLKYQGTGKIHAVVQEENMPSQRLDLDGYVGKIQFGSGRWWRPRSDDDERRGCGLVIQASLHEFYLVGYYYRLFLRRKQPTEGVMKPAIPSVYFAFPMSQFVSVEEGHFDEEGEFVADHRRNGDETSNGMWVRPDTGVLRVVLCD